MVARVLACLLLSSIAGCAGVPPRPTASLDRLLKFDEPAICGAAETLSALLRKMAEAGRDHVAVVDLPPRYRRLAGELHVVEDVRTGVDRYTTVELPLRGRWLGVPVEAVRNTSGRDNGINYFSIVFDAPLPRVRSALAGSGFDPPANGGREFFAGPDEGATIQMWVGEEGGDTVLRCDFST